MRTIRKPSIDLGNYLLWFSYESGAAFFIYKGRACVKYGSEIIAFTVVDDSKAEVITRPDWMSDYDGDVFELVIQEGHLKGFQYLDILRSIFGIQKTICVFGPTIALPTSIYKNLRDDLKVILDESFSQINFPTSDCYEISCQSGRFYIQTHSKGIPSPRLECMVQMFTEPNEGEE